LQEIIDSANPDIIIGTETWLDNTIPPPEFFPINMFNVFRTDRPPNNKNKTHGGVLLAITKDFISSEVKELQTNCEIVWAEINITRTKKSLVGSYYRPPSDEGTSLEQLEISLSRVSNITSSHIWLGGDHNLGHIDWSVPSLITGKPDAKHHLLDITS
jgi:hypothetical protein